MLHGNNVSRISCEIFVQMIDSLPAISFLNIIVTVLLLIVLFSNLKYSFLKTRQRVGETYQVLRLIVLLFSSSFFYLIIFSRQDFNENDALNLTAISVLLVVIQAMRAILDYYEIRAAGKKPDWGMKKNITDSFSNIVVFTGIYASILYSKDPIFRYTGYALCLSNFFRIMKYRFYDDLFLRQLDKGGSYVGPKANQSMTFLQGVFNVLLRTYLISALSFACTYTILVQNTYEPIQKLDKFFYIDDIKRSGNIFLDFVYFSIVTFNTIGYGDISPVATSAKLLSIFHMIFGYFVITLLFSVITGRLEVRPDSE